MSWMFMLYETYEQAVKLDLQGDDLLVPISHTLQNAHINIVIDGDGNFKRASVLEKKQVILPATEGSAGRSSGESPHALADKLQYVAEDYAKYGGIKSPYFDGYKKQLFEWCTSEFAHPKAKAVYSYINKGNVIFDLINSKILYVDNSNKLINTWMGAQEVPTPSIFRVLPKEKSSIDQGTALVCWSVEIDGDFNPDTWNDVSLQQSWELFEASQQVNKDLCYITGFNMPLAINHPAKLRHTGDKAKLISSNDSSGYTYRGKFKTDLEACSISFEVTQKSHSALRWLISRQGYRNGDQVIVAWAISGKQVPNPMIDTYNLLSLDNFDKIEENDNGLETTIDNTRDLGQLFANKLSKKLSGYRAQFDSTENIIVIALNSATPGRMSITYYRKYMACEFLNLIESWYKSHAWLQRYTRNVSNSNTSKSKPETFWFIGSPAPNAIADAAYGKTLTESLKKNLWERILPSIIEGKQIPYDIVNACVNRAKNRNSLENWEWEKNLGISCALYRGFFNRHPNLSLRKDYSMALDMENKSRDYLYGRLLAVAEYIEQIALNVAGEKRPTTSERLMQRFADRPYSTWVNIELALKPYMTRLQNNRTSFLINRQKELDLIMSNFVKDEFTSDKKLSGEFLLAYHCQRQSYRDKKLDDVNSETTNNQTLN